MPSFRRAARRDERAGAAHRSISASGSAGSLAAPRDMAIGPHQHQRRAVERRGVADRDAMHRAAARRRSAAARSSAAIRQHRQNSAARSRRRRDRGSSTRSPGRAARRCGARAPGKARRHDSRSYRPPAGRAVRHDDRRGMIDVAEMHADRMPRFLVLLDEPLADAAPHRVARPPSPPRSRRCGVALTRRLIIRQRHFRRARRGRAAAPNRSCRATSARPSLASARRELPAEIERVLDAGVHAETAIRRMGMRRIAGDEHAPVHEAVGDGALAHPERSCPRSCTARRAHARRTSARDIDALRASPRRARRAAGATNPCRRPR